MGAGQPRNDEATNFAATERERVVSFDPFTVRRVARWSECDPAGVVYTGHFTEYLISATHLFRRWLLGPDWAQIRREIQVDTPAKAVAMVFNGSLWPDDLFDVRMHAERPRTRTFSFVADAVRTGTNDSVFVGRFTSICVTAADRRVSAPIPDQLRARLVADSERSPVPASITALLSGRA